MFHRKWCTCNTLIRNVERGAISTRDYIRNHGSKCHNGMASHRYAYANELLTVWSMWILYRTPQLDTDMVFHLIANKWTKNADQSRALKGRIFYLHLQKLKTFSVGLLNMFGHEISFKFGSVFSPVCVRMWMTSCPDWIKVFEQTEHLWGRSPVWMRICRCNFPLCSKARPHRSHLYGRSFVWMRRCTWRFSFTLNILWQNSHSNGRSPVCVR